MQPPPPPPPEHLLFERCKLELVSDVVTIEKKEKKKILHHWTDEDREDDRDFVATAARLSRHEHEQHSNGDTAVTGMCSKQAGEV